MTEEYTSRGRRSGKRLRPKGAPSPAPDRLTRRLLLQLAAAAALFALWIGLCRGMPDQAAQWRENLSSLLTGSQDLWGACKQLGEELTEGEDSIDALESWCAQVFLPSSLIEDAQQEGEN